MNVEQVRKRVHEDREPFVIRLSDGRRFSIPQQDFIAIGRHAVVVIDGDGYAVTIDPLHIVSLEDVRVKNGHKQAIARRRHRFRACRCRFSGF